MKISAWNYTMYGVLVGGIVFLGTLAVVSKAKRPLIYETSVLPATMNGQWGIEYRYVVNGEESGVWLQGERDLDQYRAYLRQYGRFYGEEK